MTKALTKSEPRTDVNVALAKAQKGDQAALAILREALGPDADLWQHAGDLGRHVEEKLIATTSGDNLVLKEGLTRKLATLKAELAGPAPTPLERLLVDRIAACWLALNFAEASYAQNLKDLSREWGDYHQRRIDRSHHRYLHAIKTLAVVRRLLTPAVQVNIAERQVNVVG